MSSTPFVPGGFNPPNRRFQTPLEIRRSIVTGAVESKVMIACVFRPPTLNTPTLAYHRQISNPGTDDVAVPLTTVTPPYPPLALSSGTVIVEVTVGINGRVVSATTVRSGPGFDEAALAAARQWTFRPARIHGRLEEAFAYNRLRFPAARHVRRPAKA